MVSSNFELPQLTANKYDAERENRGSRANAGAEQQLHPRTAFLRDPNGPLSADAHERDAEDERLHANCRVQGDHAVGGKVALEHPEEIESGPEQGGLTAALDDARHASRLGHQGQDDAAPHARSGRLQKDNQTAAEGAERWVEFDEQDLIWHNFGFI